LSERLTQLRIIFTGGFQLPEYLDNFVAEDNPSRIVEPM